MLQLGDLSNDFLNDYEEKLWKKIKPELSNAAEDIKGILDEGLIRAILKEKPEQLKNNHDRLMQNLGLWESLDDYKNYVKISAKKEGDRSVDDVKIIECYKPTLDALTNIFNYKRFISISQNTSYWIAEMLKCNTCTYCNRNYTLTISRDEENNRQNNETRITRPQFDHWFSQSQHPLLALSIYNLIPSCSTCNSDIKGSLEFSLEKHIHPHVPFKDSYKFSYSKNSLDKDSVTIKVNGKKMEDTLSLMKLEKVYKAHDDFELKDLIQLSQKYSKNYINILFNEFFKDLSIDEDEIYKLIFGIDVGSHQNRAMSKFKHDIIAELRKQIKINDI